MKRVAFILLFLWGFAPLLWAQDLEKVTSDFSHVKPKPVNTVRVTDSLIVQDTLPPMASGYKWVSYRGKAQITDTGGTRNCNFFMVNRVDSILYLNVNASGIEIIRVVCTPDSFIYVNKLTYQYYRGTYGPLRILSHLPIDFQMVQAFFNGDETKLPQHQKLSFEYSDYSAVDSTRSFFNAMTFKDLNHVITINATLKNIKFDVPGPTAIRIPEKFKELKL